MFIYAHYYVQNFVGINKNVIAEVNTTLCKQKRNLISKRNKKLKTENKFVICKWLKKKKKYITSDK